eukprot:scaffold50790_cov69-Phaeocystis_antarctica.AAC.3
MSAGRPDGHTAMKHRMGSLPPDCLHYTIPGVPGWWNALLFGAIAECVCSFVVPQNAVEAAATTSAARAAQAAIS